MGASEWLSTIALIIAAGALFLEVRRWVESRPRLFLRLMPDAMEVPSLDETVKLALFVTNRGSETTTITHMFMLNYPSRWARWRNKPDFQAIVNEPNIPAELGVNKQWMGRMHYNDKAYEMRDAGRLYIGVAATHSKKNYLVRVPPRKPELVQE